MKILVAIKRVIDYNVRIHVKRDGSGVETHQVKMSMNPFDEIALEEAVRTKEKGIAQEIIAVSIGESSSQETLRAALALGADRAILVQTSQVVQPLIVAKLLREIVLQEQISCVFLGKQSIDDDCNQTGQMLAGLLKWSQATFASKIEFNANGVEVVREIDEGLETLQLQLPAVITADLRLNTPRYPSLPNIMKAKQKKITFLTPESLGVEIKPHWKILRVEPPPTRPVGVRVNSVDELLNKLQYEAKVL